VTNKNVLVTGGAGYIGSHVCKALSKAGYTPITFDNLSTGRKDFVKWGPLVVGDLRNRSDLVHLFSNHYFDTVFHFAAKAYVAQSFELPDFYYQNNVLGSINLLDVFKEFGGKFFIFSSSCATYGNPEVSIISEAIPQKPINPYGQTKLVIEEFIKSLQMTYSFQFAILRYFNAAGADGGGDVGESHLPETHIIPSLINSSLQDEEFTIYGNDYKTPDGTAIRDYVHVDDLAIAHINALKHIEAKKQNLVCNLGTGRGISILELVNELKKQNPTLRFNFGPRRKGDPDMLVASTEMSRTELNMNYSNSSIENILMTAINWHLSEMSHSKKSLIKPF
jgi:UDP-glucose-4-epimerase GalE